MKSGNIKALNSIIFFLLTFNFHLLAQLPLFDCPRGQAIEKIAQSIDSASVEDFETDNFMLDTINISTKKWINKTETINWFQKSNSVLNIDFYFNSDELILIKVVEESRKFRNLAEKITEYYYEDGIIFLTWDYAVRPTGIALKPGEEDDFFGYNKTLNDEFLRKYTNELFDRIKTAHNN